MVHCGKGQQKLCRCSSVQSIVLDWGKYLFKISAGSLKDLPACTLTDEGEGKMPTYAAKNSSHAFWGNTPKASG